MGGRVAVGWRYGRGVGGHVGDGHGGAGHGGDGTEGMATEGMARRMSRSIEVVEQRPKFFESDNKGRDA